MRFDPTLMSCLLVCGLKMEYVSAHEVKVKKGHAFGVGDKLTPIQLDGDLVLDIETDLDTGTETADTWYFVWIARRNVPDESEEIIGRFSLSATDPVLPQDCVAKRRIGIVRNNSSSDFLKFFQFGLGNEREYQWMEDRVTVLKILDGGSETSWTDIDCSVLVPHDDCIIKYGAKETGNNLVEIRPKGETMETYAPLTEHTDSDTNYMKIGTDRKVQYKQSQAGGSFDFYVMGFKEEL